MPVVRTWISKDLQCRKDQEAGGEVPKGQSVVRSEEGWIFAALFSGLVLNFCIPAASSVGQDPALQAEHDPKT